MLKTVGKMMNIKNLKIVVHTLLKLLMFFVKILDNLLNGTALALVFSRSLYKSVLLEDL